MHFSALDGQAGWACSLNTMTCVQVSILVTLSIAVAAFGSRLAAQSLPLAGRSPQPSIELDEAQTTRDAFLQAVRNAGLFCSTAVPKIELMNKPSFGQYDDVANVVRTSTWRGLSDKDRAFFQNLAGARSSKRVTASVFDAYVHQWTLVHEMAHWWQTCYHFPNKPTLYEIESNANRIALAYWRQAKPGLIVTIAPLFDKVLGEMPSPVPQQYSVAAFFNENDERLQLSSGLGYQWFQAKMFSTLKDEVPAPSFADALTNPMLKN